MSRLVAVSNRISVPKRGAAPGGLAVGLLAAMQARRGMWFGWDGETAESASSEPAIARKDGVTFASIEFDQAEYKDFYLGFCNGTLWPLFHYFVDGFRYNDTQYEAYQRMNQRYARELAPLLEPDDLIWVHDYHLFPLAQKLREAGVTQPMGLFLHIPFPNIEVLRVLAGVRRAAAGDAGLRRARLSDRDRRAGVPLAPWPTSGVRRRCRRARPSRSAAGA